MPFQIPYGDPTYNETFNTLDTRNIHNHKTKTDHSAAFLTKYNLPGLDIKKMKLKGTRTLVVSMMKQLRLRSCIFLLLRVSLKKKTI